MSNGKRVTVWVQQFSDRDHLQLQWLDPVSGKRRTKTSGTANPQEAERARSDHEHELNNGLWQEPSKITWEQFKTAATREYLPGRRKRSQQNYRDLFATLEELAPVERLAQLDARRISAFVGAMHALPQPKRGGITSFRPATIVLKLRLLHALLVWAAELGYIHEVPRFPRVSVPRKRPQPVIPELVERGLDRLKDVKLRAFALCGWLAGLRRDEAYYLQWEEQDLAPWVNLQARRIVFPAAAAKADEDQWVPLADELREALLAVPPTGPLVFGFETDSHSIVERIGRLTRRAGLCLTMRMLRRGFGCRHAARVPAQVLQRLMRHSNISITMCYYANVDAAVEEAILGPAKKECNGKCNTSREKATRARN